LSNAPLSPAGFAESTAPPRRLKRVLKAARFGLPSVGRYRRYAVVLLPGLAAIWGLTLAYLLFAPVSYKSDFTLILPGSGAGSSINLETIGQAQNTSNSAFASPTLSPTENYKQLLTADITLDAAMKLAHLAAGRFPAPTVKLVEQTNLIEVSITGKSAKGAQANAEALRQAFLDRLDALRADEAAKRTQSDLVHLQELAAKERLTERKLIDFQARHGLATLEQFNARIAAVDQLRARERDLRLELRQHQGQTRQLASSLHASPRTANLAWRLRGDPVFQELVMQYAKANADAELKAGTLGARHAAMAQANAERAQLLNAVLRRAQKLTDITRADLLGVIDLTVADGRSALLQTMDMGDAQATGTADELSELHGDLDKAAASTPDLIEQAQQLADLQRDHRVAEAVFSSALARLDTNKLDPFASYPLVQTLAAPSLPPKKSSPSLLLGLAGGMAASLLLFISCGLLWLRQPILDKMLRKG